MNPLDPRIIYPELHAALGWGILLGYWTFLPRSWLLPAFIVTEIGLLLKESVFDPWAEGPSQPFLWQGVIDFAWYHAGYALCVVFLVAHGMLALPF
jgi:hypothetical protein